MRFSRPCYDKFHRCPGWNGGGIHSAKITRCEGGYLGLHYEKRAWRWRFTSCPVCGVIVLPYMVRWLDPAYWWRWKRTEWLDAARDYRNERRNHAS